jgi:serine/threonine protein kinase
MLRVLPQNLKIKEGNKLGDGSFGSVYEVNITGPGIDHRKSFVKKVVPTSEFVQTEPLIQARYSTTFAPTETNTFGFFSETSWITERIPGVYFQYSNTNSLPLLEKLCLINNLALQMNLLHHTTPSSGPAVVHGDIKSENVLFQNKSIGLIDYGLSYFLEDDDPNTLNKRMSKNILNPSYFPREACNGYFCIKTDIYLAANVIRSLLKWSELPAQIKPFVNKFISRCLIDKGADGYKSRPDSDEFLKFFNTLHLYCYADSLENKINNSEEENITQLKNKYAATLGLLAHNCWVNLPSTPGKIKYDLNDDELNVSSAYLMRCNLSRYVKHLIGNPFLQKAVINLAQTNYFNTKTCSTLMNDPDFQKQAVLNNFTELKMQCIKQELEDFINKCEAKQKKKDSSFFGFLNFFSNNETKLIIANKLLSKLYGGTPQYNNQEYELLTKGSLGKIYNLFICIYPENKLKARIR